MALNKVRLGNYIKAYRKNCGISNLTYWDVSGVNKDKEFFEPAKQVGEDTANYKIVPPNHFACNLMHIGRDAVLPIALNRTSKNKIVSPAYTVFYLINENVILKDFFFMYLNSTEKDRFFWFHCDGSVRDGMDWSVFCDMEIELPPIEVQQKYVDIYQGMVKNQQAYERGLEDLKLVCDGYIEDLRRKMPSEPIGKYIKRYSEKNSNKRIDEVVGLSTKKEFREAQSRVNRDELAGYKVLHPLDIAFVPTTDTWKVLAFAVNHFNRDVVVSPIYEVFAVDQNIILSDYLAMWLKRDEFDRYARYNSWGSARENFSFEEMCEVRIPIPDIEIQRSISNIYEVYNMRKEINEKLKSQIKAICPILIKGSLNEVR